VRWLKGLERRLNPFPATIAAVAAIAAIIALVPAVWMVVVEDGDSRARGSDNSTTDTTPSTTTPGSSDDGDVQTRLAHAQAALASVSEFDRINGIESLQSLGDEAPSVRPQIGSMLAAFVRARAPYEGSTEYPESLAHRAPDVYRAVQVISSGGFALGEARLQLPDVDLRKIELTDMTADWSNLDLARARIDAHSELPGIILNDTNLSKAHLDHADLSNGDLRGVQAEDALLKDVDLQGAVFDGRSNLTDACLIEADLRGATGLEDANLNGVKADNTTTWPDGFRPQEHGVRQTDGCIT
jgi:hypothetical protein